MKNFTFKIQAICNTNIEKTINGMQIMNTWYRFDKNPSSKAVFGLSPGGKFQTSGVHNGYSGKFNLADLGLSNYEFETKITASSIDNDVMGVFFRYTDQFNFYMLVWDGGGGFNWGTNKLRLYKVKNNVFQLLKSNSTIGGWAGNTEYKIKVKLDGNKIECYINDDLKITHEDTNNPILNGAFGPVSNSQTTIWDSFKLKKLQEKFIIEKTLSGTAYVENYDYLHGEICSEKVINEMESKIQEYCTINGINRIDINIEKFTVQTLEPRVKVYFNPTSPSDTTMNGNDYCYCYLDYMDVELPNPEKFKGIINRNKITWSWDDINGVEEGYEIYDEDGIIIATVGKDVSSWEESGIITGTTYTRTLKTFNRYTRSSGVSATVIVGSIDSGDDIFITPSPPVNVRGIVVSNQQINWYWDEPTNIKEKKPTLYYIYDEEDNLLVITEEKKWEQINLASNNIYSIYVIGYNMAGFSGKSALASAKTNTSTPSIDTGPSGSIILDGYQYDDNSIYWYWLVDSEENVSGYRLYSDSGIIIDEIEIENEEYEYIEIGLEPGIYYTRYIVPFNEFGEGKQSNNISIIIEKEFIEEEESLEEEPWSIDIECEEINRESNNKLNSFQSGIGDLEDLKVIVSKYDNTEEFINTYQVSGYNRENNTHYYGSEYRSINKFKINGDGIFEFNDKVISPYNDIVFKRLIDSGFDMNSINYWNINLVRCNNGNVETEIINAPQIISSDLEYIEISISGRIKLIPQTPWRVKVNSGFYYINQKEYYLYSKTDINGIEEERLDFPYINVDYYINSKFIRRIKEELGIFIDYSAIDFNGVLSNVIYSPEKSGLVLYNGEESGYYESLNKVFSRECNKFKIEFDKVDSSDSQVLLYYKDLTDGIETDWINIEPGETINKLIKELKYKLELTAGKEKVFDKNINIEIATSSIDIFNNTKIDSNNIKINDLEFSGESSFISETIDLSSVLSLTDFIEELGKITSDIVGLVELFTICGPSDAIDWSGGDPEFPFVPLTSLNDIASPKIDSNGNLNKYLKIKGVLNRGITYKELENANNIITLFDGNGYLSNSKEVSGKLIINNLDYNGEFISNTIDNNGVNEYKIVEVKKEMPYRGGSVLIYTRTGDSEFLMGNWKEVKGENIVSDVKRYIEVKAVMEPGYGPVYPVSRSLIADELVNCTYNLVGGNYKLSLINNKEVGRFISTINNFSEIENYININAEINKKQGKVKIYTATSIDSYVWDDWEEVSNDLNIESNNYKFIRCKIEIEPGSMNIQKVYAQSQESFINASGGSNYNVFPFEKYISNIDSEEGMEYISEIIEVGTNGNGVNSYKKLMVGKLELVGGSVLKIETRTSDDSIIWDSWEEVINNNINSDAKKYIQYKVSVSIPIPGTVNKSKVGKISIVYDYKEYYSPVISNPKINAYIKDKMSPEIKEIKVRGNIKEYTSPEISNIIIKPKVYRLKETSPIIKNVKITATLPEIEEIEEYTVMLNDSIYGKAGTNILNNNDIDLLISEELEKQNVDLNGLRRDESSSVVGLNTNDSNIILSINSEDKIEAEIISDYKKVITNKRKDISIDDEFKGTVHPVPKNGAPVIVKDSSGEELRQVFFMDKDGNYIVEKIEDIKIYEEDNYVILSWVDIKDVKVYIDKFSNNDFKEITEFEVCNNKLYFNNSYKDDNGEIKYYNDSILRVVYKLNKSFIIDYNYDVENEYALIQTTDDVSLCTERKITVIYDTNNNDTFFEETNLDINPVKNIFSEGFIYMSDEVNDAAKIKIISNKDTFYFNNNNKNEIRNSKKENVTIIVLDKFNNPIENQRVSLKIYEHSDEAELEVYEYMGISKRMIVTDQNGKGNIYIYPKNNIGKVVLKAETNIGTSSIKIEERKILEIIEENQDINITVESDSDIINVGNDLEVRAKVSDIKGKPIKNTGVTFNIFGDKKTVITDEEGKASVISNSSGVIRPANGLWRIEVLCGNKSEYLYVKVN